MVAYLKVGPQVMTYSDNLRAAQEVEKENSINFSHSPRTQATDNAPKPQLTSFFPLGNSRATSLPQKHQACSWCTCRKKAPEGIRTNKQ